MLRKVALGPAAAGATRRAGQGSNQLGNSCEQRLERCLTCGMDSYRQTLPGIARASQGVACPRVQVVEESLQRRLELGECRVVVRCDEPIIGKELEAIAGHIECATELDVLAHELGGPERLARNQAEAF